MCHYCGYSIPFSRVCPECGEEAVRYSGSGTQKVEEELAELLPGARILRMDADTTMQKYAYDRNLSAFRDGEYDIMVGTQMVAKGLDFENVTLVGVLNADKELYNDDFQSMERTFDLITQVVGRAGRGRWSGMAVIQTMNPGNEVFRRTGTRGRLLRRHRIPHPEGSHRGEGKTRTPRKTHRVRHDARIPAVLLHRISRRTPAASGKGI